MQNLGTTQTMRDLSAQTGIPEKLTYNLINASGRALTTTAINGGDLESALRNALIGGAVDTAHGQVAGLIKGIEADYLAHKLAHALAGCAAGAAAGGACRDGAIGGVVGEIVAEAMLTQKPGLFATDAQRRDYRQQVLGYSKLVAGALSAYSGGNAQTAITTAETAVNNNFLAADRSMSRASQWGNFKQELEACRSTSNCNMDAPYARWSALSNDQQRQAMAVYRNGFATAYASDLVDNAGRVRSNTLDAPPTAPRTAVILKQQQERQAELLALFDKNSPTTSVVLSRVRYAELNTNGTGTTQLMNTANLSDAALQKEVFEYAQQLSGGRAFMPVPDKTGVWYIKLDDGTNINFQSLLPYFWMQRPEVHRLLRLF